MSRTENARMKKNGKLRHGVCSCVSALFEPSETKVHDKNVTLQAWAKQVEWQF